MTQQPHIAFRVRQGGLTLARTEGPDAEAHIWHYAFQYRAEGGVTIQHNAGGNWKRLAFLAQWRDQTANTGA